MDLHLNVNVSDFVLCGYASQVVNEFYLFDFEECIEIYACMHNLYGKIICPFLSGVFIQLALSVKISHHF